MPEPVFIVLRVRPARRASVQPVPTEPVARPAHRSSVQPAPRPVVRPARRAGVGRVE